MLKLNIIKNKLPAKEVDSKEYIISWYHHRIQNSILYLLEKKIDEKNKNSRNIVEKNLIQI